MRQAGCTTPTCNCRPCTPREAWLQTMRRLLAEMTARIFEMSLDAAHEQVGGMFDNEVEAKFSEFRVYPTFPAIVAAK